MYLTLKLTSAFLIVVIHLTTVSKFPSFNLYMITEEDGTTVTNDDRKEFQIGKITQFRNL